ARSPLALTALGDLLDDLLAVHGLLGEEQQDGGADVAAAGWPGAATAARVTTTAVTRTEAGPAGAEPRSARTEAGPAGAEAPTAVGRSAEPAASAAACAAPASGAVAAEPGRVVGHGREAVATATAGPRPGALAERLGRVLGDVRGPAPVLVCVAHGMCLLWFVGLRVIRGAVAGRSGLATVASSFSGSAIR